MRANYFSDLSEEGLQWISSFQRCPGPNPNENKRHAVDDLEYRSCKLYCLCAGSIAGSNRVSNYSSSFSLQFLKSGRLLARDAPHQGFAGVYSFFGN